MNQKEIEAVETRMKKFEENTGCELLLVVANASDPYPAASLRFGFISGFLISLTFSYYLEFHHSLLWPISFFLTVLLMSWVGKHPWAKKFALSSWEIDRECKEKAIEFFHNLGTSQVAHKVTAMIMISVLEKRVEVLVDQTLKTKINHEELDRLIEIMLPHFSRGNIGEGFLQSIDELELKILSSFGGKVTENNHFQLKDKIEFILV